MFNHNSLLGTGVMSQRILSRECTGGGQNSMVRNSGSQQAIEMRSSKYIIQYILGENPGKSNFVD